MYVRYDNQNGDGYVFDDSGAFIGIEEELAKKNPELFYSTEPLSPYSRDNQASAFPFSRYERMSGMSMWEYYAGQAMIGLLAAQGGQNMRNHSVQENLVEAAFEFASAMVKLSNLGPRQLWSRYAKHEANRQNVGARQRQNVENK